MSYTGVINKFKEYLPITDKTPLISLREGNTPLLLAENLRKKIKADFNIYLKFEGANPTGSFKDRGMTVAVSKAVEEGAKAVICASTGNTSASAAAYAAKAGIKCLVLIPEGAIALGKLSQALVHGAQVVSVKANFDQALNLVREISNKLSIVCVNSINPFRLEGQKTASFEIIEELAAVPDYLAIPVGNAGNITAYWKGFKEYSQRQKNNLLPKMLGFQAAGAAPIVEGHPVENPQTIASAIRIGNPASWKGAVAARDESEGLIDKVTDEEIIEAYKLIASYEGIFCEPASAASVAGVIKLNKEGKFKTDNKVVCVLTGHGLKDPERAISVSQKPLPVEPRLEEIAKLLNY